jgi:hypothetical protein
LSLVPVPPFLRGVRGDRLSGAKNVALIGFGLKLTPMAGYAPLPEVLRDDGDDGAFFDLVVEFGDVFVEHADAAVGDGLTDQFGLIGAVEA